MLFPPLIVLGLAARCILAASPYAECQSTSGKVDDPVAGCPDGTVFVSQTDDRAQFQTIQSAVLSLPMDNSSQWILVGEGIYQDAVNVTRVGPITILGQSDSTDTREQNLVTVFNTTFINQTAQNPMLQDNADSQVLTIAPNKYSVWTGSGYYGATPEPIPDEYGCTDFKSYNINWENRAANQSTGPALALGVGFANASFYGCSFKSWQDTLFIGKNASVVFRKSQVLGQTDYIYGFGTAYFLESELGARAGGHTTAWKGTPNFTNTYGCYFDNCNIVRSPEPFAQNLTGVMDLGRPWNNASTVVYLNSFMDESVAPGGFSIWSESDPRNGSLLFYAEYNSTGPGFNQSARVGFDHILNETEAQKFSVESVFGGTPSWVDFDF